LSINQGRECMKLENEQKSEKQANCKGFHEISSKYQDSSCNLLRGVRGLNPRMFIERGKLCKTRRFVMDLNPFGY